ncbi:ligase-associated DNA damage response endonuclease PdeM [Fodinicurvata fenggangensis]|uniref:ligase-associated DNA damage response endonuclease PdeM n=1 Tax=Fodinicurvata fenggangensis TaxID=1121830 RepID=UPI00068D411B|nr:ligase-associated DNA damage response endonuclease PdeM [Fodinicurvata fenggangensis]
MQQAFDFPETVELGSFRFNGADLVTDPSGALWWPAEGCLVVADLHLEKGSSFAARGSFLPPYDSRETLARLQAVLARRQPQRVICLGDSFHDRQAGERLDAAERERLKALTRAHDWIWIAGNHDPEPPRELGGEVTAEVEMRRLVFRHEAEARREDRGEVSGHYHPKAAVRVKGRHFSRPCFVFDGSRLILPSFGAYTGGLDVFAPALRTLLAPDFRVRLIDGRKVYGFSSEMLEPLTVSA